MTESQRALIDYHMLKSMADSLRGGFHFSFNTDDMADMLDRVASKVKPEPRLVEESQ